MKMRSHAREEHGHGYEVGTTEMPTALGRLVAWESGGDQLPGQCDLDGITILVQDIQPRFG
ncbi:hypothetical protein RBT96_32220, partial [Pseudomonas aeruginosa]|uniref:hypothetical protein n=1 Tax=Pseudomonas aeruginosa TaxID=287 RepID=UPI0027D3DD30